jgi:hypothetical protein
LFLLGEVEVDLEVNSEREKESIDEKSVEDQTLFLLNGSYGKLKTNQETKLKSPQNKKLDRMKERRNAKLERIKLRELKQAQKRILRLNNDKD